MTALFVPKDGRITSQNVLASVGGGEVMEIVSPGNEAAGNTYQVTTNVLGAFFSAYAIGRPVAVSFGANLKPQAAELLVPYDFVLNVAFAANLSTSKGYANTVPTSDAVFTLNKNGVSFGSATFAAGAHTATFSSSAVSFVPGDVLSVVCPSPRDATMADICLTLLGAVTAAP